MSDFTNSPNMNLPVPTVGTDPGPDWANNLNASLTLIDQHDHSSGHGVQISPSGLNINSDLPMNGNNLITARSLRLSSQSGALALATDLNCIYVTGIDLYYNDGNGVQIRITQGGGVAGSPGTIANLASPATASYVSANQTFVWQSDASTPANMDAASLLLRNLSANSFALTLNPPAAMGANFALTLPVLPASQKFMTLDASGSMSASWAVDNSTLAISSNQVIVKSGGITGTQITNNINLPGKSSQVESKNIIVSSQNATNQLAIIRGTVGAAGNIPFGEGFTVTRLGLGDYSIAYGNPFMSNETATVTCTPVAGQTDQYTCVVYSQSELGVRVSTYNQFAGTAVDSSFNFIAIGIRS